MAASSFETRFALLRMDEGGTRTSIRHASRLGPAKDFVGAAYPKKVACNPKPIVALKTAWMVSNSKPLTTVSTNGNIIRPTGSMMLATKATHRTLVRIG